MSCSMVLNLIGLNNYHGIFKRYNSKVFFLEAIRKSKYLADTIYCNYCIGPFAVTFRIWNNSPYYDIYSPL